MPEALAATFPDAVMELEAYARSLATDGLTRGLIGPREVPRIWERHIANCAVVEELIPRDSSITDVGSGAGLPGLVLAIVRPDISVTLVEPLLRRTTYLSETVTTLGLANRVEVLRGRAQDFHGKLRTDVVTSRAVAALGDLVGWSWPLVAPGGSIVAMKGETAPAEVVAAQPIFTRLGIASPQIQTMTCSNRSSSATVVVIRRVDAPR